MSTTTFTPPPLKSVELTDLERKQLGVFVSKHGTQGRAAMALGVSRGVLQRTLQVGSGGELNISLIRSKISSILVDC